MKSEGTIEFYENLWLREWADMERFNPTARHLKRTIVALIDKVMPIETILDVGCGMGLNVRDLRQHYPSIRITGSDLSAPILAMARKYVGEDPAVDFVTLDLGKAALERQFDLVLCNQVLEHLEDDRAAIDHLVQMARRYVLITVPGGRFNSTSQLVGHFRHYSRADICAKLTAAGLHILHQQEWGFPIHSLYKLLLGLLPERMQKSVGMGNYGWGKKALSNAIYLAFYANLWDKGANVIVLAEKTSSPR
jgi:SAM-dependent methyltransferase